MNIVGARIDGRLVHGQVANLWTPKLQADRIIVVDEEAAKSDIQKSGLRMATPPIFMHSAPEGTTQLFHVEYFNNDAYLSQSGQLYGEAGAMAYGKIFTFGPTFRAEESKVQE